MWNAGHAVVSAYDQRLKALLAEVAIVYKPQTDLLMHLPVPIEISNANTTIDAELEQEREKRLVFGSIAIGISVVAKAEASGEFFRQ